MRIADIPGLSVIAGRHPSRYTKKPAESGGTASPDEVPGASGSAPEHLVIRPAAVADGIIDVTALTAPEGFVAPEAGPFTQEGDVVLETSLPFAAAYVGPGEEGLFVPNTCVVLRLDEEGRGRLDPLFLCGFLNLPLTNELMRARATGLRGLVMNGKQVGDIEIPDAPIEEQRLVGRLVAARMAQVRARRLAEQAEEKLMGAAYLGCEAVRKALAGDRVRTGEPTGDTRADAGSEEK